ncbi:DUF3889 domain-containing protein [Solibacillus daqui]|uniref:DUF3889 domain-containing protein n=1 Tax=Solibacillus daqui TaxID=2912187 RepID=UPI002367200F|nr:DUF3889 domain-containing protein [Solibacillus daqui]
MKFKKIGVRIVLITALFMPLNTLPIVHAQQEAPAYAKWGILAMEETQKRYPGAKIIDYLHQGREIKGIVTIEKFKLWLKKGDKEFGVFVSIVFVTDTEKIVVIEFQETDR